MEHSCYKCGATLDEGRAFCPHCSAPQIRVAAAEPATSSIPARAWQEQDPVAATPLQPGKIIWSDAFPAAALAAIISSILMVIPLGAFGLGTLATGILAVLLYQRRNPDANLTPGMGARLGAVGGVVGFGLFSFVSALSALVFGIGAQIRGSVLEAINQAAARSGDPQARQALEFFKTPGGMAIVIVAALVFLFAGFLALSSLGGALGAVLLRRKDRR